MCVCVCVCVLLLDLFQDDLRCLFSPHKKSKFHGATNRDRGGIGTHYPGKWLVSVSVRTEERVQPLLHLSISKSYQLSSTDSPLPTVG